jgi:hypothetical protein
MNPNVYLELFEDEMGLDTLGLEYLYPELVKLIQRRTLPDFYQHFWCFYPYEFDVRDKSKMIPSRFATNTAEYRVVDETVDSFKMEIIDVHLDKSAIEKNEYDHTQNRTGYINNLIEWGGSFDDVLLGSLAADTMSTQRYMVGLAPVVKLMGDKVLSVKNIPSGMNHLVTLTVVIPSIIPIRMIYKRQFIALAKLDVQTWLWNRLKYMQDIVTPAGNIDLKISDWESSANDRESFLKELRQISYADRMATGSVFMVI